MNKKIGFIGQGWIGKNYADDMEDRGFEVVRYSENAFKENKEKIKECDIVFIAVPTPTTPRGFDSSILRKVIRLVGDKKIAVIKSTILPGSTEIIQEENPNIYVLHSPEFLVQANAKYDASTPKRNIIGIPKDNNELRKAAQEVMDVLPEALYKVICSAKEAELVKYGGNCFLYFKVIYINLLYDLAKKLECDWEKVRNSIAADPRIGSSHMEPLHDNGRGVGGGCLVKDFAAFTRMYDEITGDNTGLKIFDSVKNKNIELLKNSGKNLDILKAVYGEEAIIDN